MALQGPGKHGLPEIEQGADSVTSAVCLDACSVLTARAYLQSMVLGMARSCPTDILVACGTFITVASISRAANTAHAVCPSIQPEKGITSQHTDWSCSRNQRYAGPADLDAPPHEQ
jgi:hypothetical protein